MRFLPAVVALVPSLSSAQSIPADSTVRAIVETRVDAGHYAGIAVGFVTRDGRRQVTAYGPDAGVQPFDGNTVFEIGSITKVFTSTILADMVRKGEVALDDPVVKHLPDGTRVPERNGRQITLLDLATHTSGLPRLPANLAPTDMRNPYAAYTADRMFEFLGGYTLARDIGAQYDYSNLGAGLLGLALSHRAGMGYEPLVTTRVLDPLGMRDTRITYTPSMRERLAPGHTERGDLAPGWDFAAFAGTGAIRSTVSDMLTFLRANLDTTGPSGATLLMTHAERRPGPAPVTTMGLAWHRTRVPSGATIVWHNGGTGGYRSFGGFNEETGVAVIVLTNTSTSVDEIGMHLLDSSVRLPAVRAEVTLPEATLREYVGEYELAPNFSVAVTLESGALYAQATGQPRFAVFAEARDRFFLRVVDARIMFTRDSSGAVTGLVLHQDGRDTPGRRKPPGR